MLGSEPGRGGGGAKSFHGDDRALVGAAGEADYRTAAVWPAATSLKIAELEAKEGDT